MATGTATATAGSDILPRISGTFSVQGAYPTFYGSPSPGRARAAHTLITQYRNDSANQLTLGGKWPADADSGTVNWTTVIFNPSSGQFNVTVFAVGTSDTPAMAQNFVCTYVDPTHVTLNRNWPLTTGSTRSIYSANLAGIGQQPFMLGGSKSLALQWASLNANPTIASAFRNLVQQAAAWMFSTASTPTCWDLTMPACSIAVSRRSCRPPISLAGYRTSNCAYGGDPAFIVAERELTAESSTALRADYDRKEARRPRSMGGYAATGLCGPRAVLMPAVLFNSGRREIISA